MTSNSEITTRDLNSFLKENGLSIEYAGNKSGNGYLYVSIGGAIAIGEHVYRYHAIPTQIDGEPFDEACLGKRTRWSKLSARQKVELLGAPAVQAARESFALIVERSVVELLQLAKEHQLSQEEAFEALLALDSCSHTFYERYVVAKDRLGAAIQRRTFESMAEKTKSAINLADYPASFSAAHRMERKLIALLGEPNSGKTYEAMQALIAAKTGVYLAPLRLLALENYEKLLEAGVSASMVTGEECRITEDSTHTASTIEMLDFGTPVEVAVIDEIQVIDDPHRGAAWTAAVCGVPASTVYIVGSLTSEAAVRELAKRLNCELEVKILKRKGPLSVEHKAIKDINQLKQGDALIAFSRKEVLRWREELSSKGVSVAMVYGNLSPEVRRAQAALFREGKVDILIGTDALAMGLNMPISRVVFTNYEKFDGVETVEIPDWLAQQIGGRAGRFGIHEHGYVNAFGEDVLNRVREMMHSPLAPIRERGFWVAPTIEHLVKIRDATGSDKLNELLLQFKKHINVHDSFFLPAALTDQLERASWLDTLALPLEDRFLLSLVPLSLHLPLHYQAYESWCLRWAAGETCVLKPANIKLSEDSLQLAEDTCKLYSGYVWLSYRRPDHFPSGELALKWVREMSESIDQFFRESMSRRMANAIKNGKKKGAVEPSEPSGPPNRRDKKREDDSRREEKNARLQSAHAAGERARTESAARRAPPDMETRLAARRKILGL